MIYLWAECLYRIFGGCRNGEGENTYADSVIE